MTEYKIRDITTGLYMDRDIRDGQIMWHKTGHGWSSTEEIEVHMVKTAATKHQISPLWEIEIVDVNTSTIVDRYPAIVHAPQQK